MNQPQDNRDAKLALINAILNAYHTTRVVQTDPAVHILSKMGGDLDRRIAEIKGEAPSVAPAVSFLSEAIAIEKELEAFFRERGKNPRYDTDTRKAYANHMRVARERAIGLQTIASRRGVS
jgi:hypothetical protein